MAAEPLRRLPATPAWDTTKSRPSGVEAAAPDPLDVRGLARLLPSGGMPTNRRPRPPESAFVVALQRIHGNAFVGRLIATSVDRDGGRAPRANEVACAVQPVPGPPGGRDRGGRDKAGTPGGAFAPELTAAAPAVRRMGTEGRAGRSAPLADTGICPVCGRRGQGTCACGETFVPTGPPGTIQALRTLDPLVASRRRAPALDRAPSATPARPGNAREPVHAAAGATPENARLAQAIDALDELEDAELAKLREHAVVAATRPDGDDRERRRRTLEKIGFLAQRPGIRTLLLDSPGMTLHAIEFLAKRRGLDRLEGSWETPGKSIPRDPTSRRLDVRVMIEQGVRDTGSFKKALAGFYHTREVEPDIAFFQEDADRFKGEFRGQARLTAVRILDDSALAIGKVLKSYGIPPLLASGAARELARGVSNVQTEARAVIEAAKRSDDVDKPAKVQHREWLAIRVGGLKKHQQAIKKLLQEDRELFERYRKNRSDKSITERGRALDRELEAARGALRTAWIKAELRHPVLAAYRRGGELEDVDLGGLDTDPVDKQMQAVVAQLLPKVVDIGKAKGRLKHDKDFALKLPAVVAATRANMFIPAGSIRAGIVNDLVAEAEDDDTWIQLAALALALVTLVPTGGASLAIPAGMASAGLAVYSVTREWEKYKTQKTLSNTSLDLARSLSTEEPSLAGFAISLVELGLEAIPMAGAFKKARELKQLVRAGEDTTAVVADLNRIGKQVNAPDLGKRALREVEQSTPQSAAGGAKQGAKQTGDIPGKTGGPKPGQDTKLLEQTPGAVGGKRVLAEYPALSGKGKIKVVEGEGLVHCWNPCARIKVEYAAELDDPKNAHLKSALADAEKIADPMKKAQAGGQVEDGLSKARAAALTRAGKPGPRLIPDWSGDFPARDLIRGGTQVSGHFPMTATPNAVLFRRDPASGITSYAVYDHAGGIIKRVDVTGKAHGGVPTPHTLRYIENVNPKTGAVFRRAPNTVTPATPNEAAV